MHQVLVDIDNKPKLKQKDDSVYVAGGSAGAGAGEWGEGEGAAPVARLHRLTSRVVGSRLDKCHYRMQTQYFSIFRLSLLSTTACLESNSNIQEHNCLSLKRLLV